MAGETILTIVGNLTADPELRTTGTGTQVCGFTIASTPRETKAKPGALVYQLLRLVILCALVLTI